MDNSRIKTKRIYAENKLLEKDPLNIATAYPFDDGMDIWYALFVGPHDSVYKGGHYICKILLSAKYPLTPPDFIFLTPNGRFEINKKICLTITGFHSDMWQSTITIKTMLIQIFSVFYQDVDSGIAHLIPPALGTSPTERKKFAINSISYNNTNYKEIYQNFNFTHLNDGSLSSIITENKDDTIKDGKIKDEKIKDDKIKDDKIKDEPIKEEKKDEKKDEPIKDEKNKDEPIKDEKKKKGRPKKIV
jgi:ubiquitin-protein ligase